MNIYTLHKAGSFRPPSLDCDAEIETSQLTRDKLPRPNLELVTEEKNLSCSTPGTSHTSGSEHSSSLGEKTTPRHNVTHTVTNNLVNNVTDNGRVSVSRIDATGVITGTNAPQMLSSKATLNQEQKVRAKKVKNSTFSSSKVLKVKHPALIHIQAKDEFMIFEDNTDLVSYITTPSAIRTSPLETDYLIIDHDEFAEEESLFSALTVPKALRRKRNKKKSKSKNDVTKKDVDKVEESNKNCEKSCEEQEHESLKLAPSTSSESIEQQDKPHDLPATPPKRLRQNSIDQLKSVSDSPKFNNSGSSRKSDLRGGRRVQKANDQSEGSEGHEETGLSSQIQEKGLPTSQNEEAEDENEHDSQQEHMKKLSEKEISKDVILEEEDALKTSLSIASVDTTDDKREKPQPPQGQEEEESRGPHEDDNEKSPEQDGVNTQSCSLKEKDTFQNNSFKHVSEVNRDVVAAKAALFGIDVTARTVIDSTARTSNEGSHSGSEELRKVPNSHRGRKSFKIWWLPTSYFCNHRRKKVQEESAKTPLIVSDGTVPYMKQK